MFGHSLVGKTLAEVANETSADFRGGYAVFVLQSADDTIGKEIDMSYSIRAILKEHPGVAQYTVVYESDFYGTTVLRVEDTTCLTDL